ncbi:pentatricopeptide repeat-containing protein At5g66520-like [Impatiens glandulifera]|uniref:pentatricopeptide repeat-containing protein At5g66520-like n=1 Tax=Impatiens glandulifera TaxID=253017 RepID=UPI001FB13828|nr:pentatricopeptide repeat-containing protein At5g66520-like [Impatiens glandulifera]
MIKKAVITTSNQSIITLIEKCKNMKEIKQIHAHIITQGNFSTFHHHNHRRHHTPPEILKLVTFYAISSSGGNLAYAKAIFDHQQYPAVALYNTIIRGFSVSSRNHDLEPFALYQRMLSCSLRPNNYTFTFLIKACVKFPIIHYGMQVHTHVVKFGFESDSHIQCTMIRFYGNWNQLDAAQKLFHICSRNDIVSMNSMIDVYVKCGEMQQARQMFDTMPVRDLASFNTMINGYGISGSVKDARNLFDEMFERNLVTWNSMLAVYVNCGMMEDAYKVFQDMPYRDVISWNAMLTCYAQNGKPNEAIALFDEMQVADVKPDESTVVSLLSACGQLGMLDKGLQVLCYVDDCEVENNPIVGTALVDMYAKCGIISRAIEVFDLIKRKDVLAWNTMITGLAIHGYAKEGRVLFERMQKEGFVPNDMTFVALLSAYRHAGLIEEGRRLLSCMSRTYGIEPKEEHYGCVVDLLARTGRLEEAMCMIREMPLEINASNWGSLLGGYKIHGYSQGSESVGNCLIGLEPLHSGRYIILSNMYASAKRWEDAARVRNLMKSRHVCKAPGMSMIEIKGIAHQFVAGDTSHPDRVLIYKTVGEILDRLKVTDGYLPDVEHVFLDIEEEEKEHSLSVHSEKLAIAYGLLHSHDGETIRVIKNLRVCSDCHNVLRMISSVYRRDIIMRDRIRFHHFKDGLCSCQDFW